MSFNNFEKNEINKDEKNNININKKQIFKDNPNLIFKKFLNIQNQFSCDTLSIEKFDFFILNQISYIAIPDYFCFVSNSLFILKINQSLNLEKKLSLEGHKSPIIYVKNFYDKNNDQNYLFTSDKIFLVIIWKIISEKSIIIKQTITTKYNKEIFSGLILFNPKNIFILTSNDSNIYSTEYDFLSGDFKRDIPGTKNNQTFYILNYNDFIIELCMDKIVIYNLLEENDICEINNENTKGKNSNGIIIKDSVFSVNYSSGKIIVVNLIQKNIQYILNINHNNCLYSLLEWNSYYIIISDTKNNRLNILDINQMKIINSLKVHINPIYIKKIKLNKKKYNNESILLILGNKMFFELWLKMNHY